MEDINTLPIITRKRTISQSSADSTTYSHSKRSISLEKDQLDSDNDNEGSLGASRLNLADSPSPPSILPPAYSTANTLTSPTSPTPPDPIQQPIILNDISPSSDFNLSVGDEYFLISATWYKKWTASCSPSSTRDKTSVDNSEVGPIDNSDLWDEKGELKKPLVEGEDMELVNKMGWDYLSAWYGYYGSPISRPVINPSGKANQSRIEFHPPTFIFYILLPSTSTLPIPLPLTPPPKRNLSISKTITDLSNLASSALQTTRKLRLWRINIDSIIPKEEDGFILSQDWDQVLGKELLVKEVGDELNTLIEAYLEDEVSKIIVEQVDESGNWIIDTPPPATSLLLLPSSTPTPLFGSEDFFSGLEKRTYGNILTPRYGGPKQGTGGIRLIPTPGGPKDSSSSTSSSEKGNFFSALTRSKSNSGAGGAVRGQRGLTGLQNLGNTCFMNSALQCMSNTKELKEYFLAGVYKSELNVDNPLGMNGQVASSFGALLERLWTSAPHSSFPPREFKSALSKFAPSFSGYGQQDSQELLAFLLDGIHEDLNRILKKPVTVAPDWQSGGGEKEMVEMARKCWELYRSRNDSVIVDLFQGQYRSTVVCPDCDKVSITFDPFMYVTTNLPVNKKWTGTVYVVPKDSDRPRYTVELQLPKNATIKNAKSAVAGFLNMDPKTLQSGEVWKHRFYKAWYDDDLISELGNGDILVFYETTLALPQPKPRFYGKSKPATTVVPKDPSEPTLVVVVHKVKKNVSKLKNAFTSINNRNEDFGNPFLVSLSVEEARTVGGIYKAIGRQYARVSKRSADLLEITQDDEDEEEAEVEEEFERGKEDNDEEMVEVKIGEAPEEDEMDVDSTTTSSSSFVQVPSASIDGETVPQREVEEGETEGVYRPTVEMPPPTPSSTSTLPPLLPPRPSTSKTTQLPKLSGKKPTPLFKMFVSKTRKNDNALPFGSGETASDTVSLESRIPSRTTSLTKDNLQHQQFPSTSSSATISIRRVDSNSSDESPSTPPPSTPSPAPILPPSQPSSPPPQLPLVSTGDFIVADWDPAALDHFFGGDGSGDQSLWEEFTSFVDPAVTSSKQKKGAKKDITLEDCLNEFTKEERLGEDDTWYCPDCKKHQQATKKVEIWKSPDILVFALKRFSSSRYSRDKIDDFVDFPIEGFNMEPFVEGDKAERRILIQEGKEEEGTEPLVYDLYAVDNHYGGLGGGHYTAYAKNPENDKWYDYDDSRVTALSDPNSVKTPAAYLLFYRRRTARPIGAKSKELVDFAINSQSVSATNSDSGADTFPSTSSSVNFPGPHLDSTPPSSLPLHEDEGYGEPLTLSRLGTHSSDDYLPLDNGFGTSRSSSDDNLYAGARFSGMFPRRHTPTSDTEAELGTPPSGRMSPFDVVGGDMFPSLTEDIDETVDLVLPDEEEEKTLPALMDVID